MKALSLKQPWLWCITDQDKRVENRTWKPPADIIGQRIVLHASKRDDTVEHRIIRDLTGGAVPPNDIPRGSIVATAKVVGWVDEYGEFNGPSPCLGHYMDNRWFFGPVGWILDDVEKLKVPVPCRGRLGLWDVPDDLLQYVI